MSKYGQNPSFQLCHCPFCPFFYSWARPLTSIQTFSFWAVSFLFAWSFQTRWESGFQDGCQDACAAVSAALPPALTPRQNARRVARGWAGRRRRYTWEWCVQRRCLPPLEHTAHLSPQQGLHAPFPSGEKNFSELRFCCLRLYQQTIPQKHVRHITALICGVCLCLWHYSHKKQPVTRLKYLGLCFVSATQSDLHAQKCFWIWLQFNWGHKSFGNIEMERQNCDAVQAFRTVSYINACWHESTELIFYSNHNEWSNILFFMPHFPADLWKFPSLIPTWSLSRERSSAQKRACVARANQRIERICRSAGKLNKSSSRSQTILKSRGPFIIRPTKQGKALCKTSLGYAGLQNILHEL